MFLVDTKVDVQYKDGGVRMERIPNAVYTKELREEAVKLVTEQGLSIPDVGRRLSIPKSTISYWVKEERKGKLSCLGSSRKSLTETEMELAKIKRLLCMAYRCSFQTCTGRSTTGNRDTSSTYKKPWNLWTTKTPEGPCRIWNQGRYMQDQADQKET
jgi:transposase